MRLDLTAARSSFVLLLVVFCLGSHAQTPNPQLGPGRRYTTIQRLAPERLRAVHEDRQRFAASRSPKPLAILNDYRAVLHAHAEDAAHTGGTRAELLEAAKRTGVQVVMLTDHVRPERDFIDDSWRGIHEGVLFIPGAEHEGFLAYPIRSIKGKTWVSREAYVRLVRSGGGNIFLSHVEDKLDWPTEELDGLEIYNHHTDIKDEGAFTMWLQGALSNPARLAQLVQALRDYPQEVFGAQQDYLAAILGKWDRDSQTHRLTGIAANDCHHNQVFTVTAIDEKTIEIGFITSKSTTTRVTADRVPSVAELTRNKKPGELIARLDFDPYERSLSYVTTHIFASELSENAIRDALSRGHAYVAHDWLCDPRGFAFVAVDRSSNRTKHEPHIMGDEIPFGNSLRLKVAVPLNCTIKLLRNGEVARTIQSDHLEFDVVERGVYRIEAWLQVDGEQRPWIYSNPIYVK